nr:hypothetical protein Iba_scaffold1680732CG0010 [Ipomoea batatas]
MTIQEVLVPRPIRQDGGHHGIQGSSRTEIPAHSITQNDATRFGSEYGASEAELTKSFDLISYSVSLPQKSPLFTLTGIDQKLRVTGMRRDASSLILSLHRVYAIMLLHTTSAAGRMADEAVLLFFLLRGCRSPRSSHLRVWPTEPLSGGGTRRWRNAAMASAAGKAKLSKGSSGRFRGHFILTNSVFSFYNVPAVKH